MVENPPAEKTRSGEFLREVAGKNGKCVSSYVSINNILNDVRKFPLNYK